MKTKEIRKDWKWGIGKAIATIGVWVVCGQVVIAGHSGWILAIAGLATAVIWA
jgi:hypothetical protein